MRHKPASHYLIKAEEGSFTIFSDLPGLWNFLKIQLAEARNLRTKSMLPASLRNIFLFLKIFSVEFYS